MFPTITTLPAATEFFIAHAGQSYNPATETIEEGTARNARDLAGAELAARNLGWTVQWSDDWDGDHSYLDQATFDGYIVTTCEMATLYDADGDVISSCVAIDAALPPPKTVESGRKVGERFNQLERHVLEVIEQEYKGADRVPYDTFVKTCAEMMVAPAEGERDLRHRNMERTVKGLSKRKDPKVEIEHGNVIICVA